MFTIVPHLEIVSPFIRLVLEHKGEDFSIEEIKTVFDFVSTAGFQLQKIVPGQLKRNILDEDRSVTGETFQVNKICPFKVLDLEGKGHDDATGWLDQVWSLMLIQSCKKVSSADLRRNLSAEVVRSQPLEPIKLNSSGDFLHECPPLHYGCLVDHTRDHNRFTGNVGVHGIFCRGHLDCKPSNATQNVILCRSCGLRVPVPVSVKTYGELREAMFIALGPTTD